MEKTNNKKRYGVIAVVLVALLAAGVGTWAWLQATDQVKNEFTVGNIGKPEVKPDPDHPDKPGTTPTESVDGYLFETKWNDKSKMIPGNEINKNPNVGIGKDSDSSYVFIYVKNAIVKTNAENALAKTPYFTLNNNWSPVADQVTTNTDGQYVSGLFVYTASVPNVPAVLAPIAKTETTEAKAAYTGELFSTVHIPAAMNSADVVASPAMTVSCYIFGADQGGADNALTQAKAWAADQAK